MIRSPGAYATKEGARAGAPSAVRARACGLLLLLAAGARTPLGAAEPPGVLAIERSEQLDAIPAETLAVRVGLPLEQINSDRQEKLRAWIAGGGTAWFHTDAAQTVGLRVTSPESALEATGKAVMAAPFASSQVLDGVRKVRYALADGDALLLPDDGVLPLLSVEGLPATREGTLLVAGWRRVGAGEVFFMPTQVSPSLLDGARLLASWRERCAGRPKELLVPVDAVLRMAGAGADGETGAPPSPDQCVEAVGAWASAAERGEVASRVGGPADRGFLPITAGDIKRVRGALGLGRPASVAHGAPDLDQVQALAAVWLAREQYRSGRVDRAAEWLSVATRTDAGLDATHAWQGCVLRTRAADIGRPAPDRAALLREAAGEFDAAEHGADELEFDRATLREWSEQARREADLFAIEPPLADVRGPFVVRYDQGDPSVQDAMAGLQAAMGIITSEFGVRMDDTEVLLFPSFQAYASYMAAAGYEPVTEWESASSDGKRIFSYLQPGRDYAGTMAHELGHLAVASLAEGGAGVPQWINEGIACAVTPGQPDPRPVTERAFRDGALMGIANLNAPAAEYDRGPATLLYLQSEQMVDFMARRFGKYAVLSVLRQIGSGVPADTAMLRTVGMDQAQFLNLWVASDFR